MALTLSVACNYQEEIRKSRFLAQAAPVRSAAEAQAFIQLASDPGASHNCWAWKVGQQYRSSDDGEPGGTAGRPMLAAIEAQGFDCVVVVVTRWYGGIQLGTGGLARAYGGSAAKCLQGCQHLERVQRQHGHCHLYFAELPLLKAQLAGLDALLQTEQYDGEGAQLELAIPPAQLPTLQRLLADLSRGRVQLQLDDVDN
mgnify:FL=1